MSNVKLLEDLLSDATKASEGKVVFNFGIGLRHTKTEKLYQTSESGRIA